MTAALKHYLQTIEQALKAGNATEHTHRPALKALLETLDLDITATNEPKRIACGAPDYIITRHGLTVGYIEAKDVGLSLDQVEKSDQLKRYRHALENLILTDYLEFRWYVDGEPRQSARLARWAGDKLKREKGGPQAITDLLTNFLQHQPEQINTPHDLARRMARLTHIIRDIIITAFETEQASPLLQNWREAFAKVLIADLNLPEKTAEFADMVAQTLAYGLFTARIMSNADPPQSPRNRGEVQSGGQPSFPPPVDGGIRGGLRFNRYDAQRLIPKSNPLLRDFFARITGIDMDDEPFAPFFDDLVNLLAHTDMEAVLTDFGRRTRQEDPVVHFYETFLAAYDPKLREARGVYYTPEPVVSYIIRSVDHLLKTRFGCPQGLADSSRIKIPNTNPSLKVKGKKETRKTSDSHKVLILDPATGTGTFLYAVIDHIRQQFMQQGNAGLWPGYVKNHLLPRLFGFELLMAPYAVAHFKLSLQLLGRDLPDPLSRQWAYTPTDDERLGIFLTNTLEEPHEMTGLPLFTQRVADETNAANEVKQFLPILVMIGNPPYSVSSTNKGDHIEGLMDTYKKAVRSERNIQPLSDDYIKFIRFAHDRIERTEQGIIGLITNHAYLAGLIHRGMREELIKSFSEIYILNLHGNATIGEVAPDGSPDENIFDIRQGVSIVLLVKGKEQKGSSEIRYIDLWGKRSAKYTYLLENDINTTNWKILTPQTPYFFLVPKDFDLESEYKVGWSLTDIFVVSSLGIEFGSKQYLLSHTPDTIGRFIENVLLNEKVSEELLSTQYKLKTTSGWRLQSLRQTEFSRGYDENLVIKCAESPFNFQYTYHSTILRRPQLAILQNLHRSNVALLTLRQSRGTEVGHFFAVNTIYSKDVVSIKDRATGFPLYLYPSEETTRQTSLFDISPWPSDAAHEGRVPNLDPDFVAEMERRLGVRFVPHSPGSGVDSEKQPHPPAPSPIRGGGAESPADQRDSGLSQGDDAESPTGQRGSDLAQGDDAESPTGQRGSDLSKDKGIESPSPESGEGLGEGVVLPERGGWRTSPDLWLRLKPIARQMRREPTPAEKALWQRLRKKQLGPKFRRQHTIDRFIVDFYCREARLIIEVDGPIHDYTPQEDAIRQEFLESQGYRVLRFTNEEVLTELEAVLVRIREAVEGSHFSASATALEREPHPPTPSPNRGGGVEAPADQRSSNSYQGDDAESPSPDSGEGLGEGVSTSGIFTPEDIFHYIYALFHSPTYRDRYAEFLKIDFPRLPLTADVALFRTLCDLGRELVALHLLESPAVGQPITRYPAPGDNTVQRAHPKYTPPTAEQPGRVYINKTQYFEGVPPDVWEFYIGGYQVCHKWLKDRKGRQLTYDDLTHYQQIIVALRETIRVMAEIDGAIEEWPLG